MGNNESKIFLNYLKLKHEFEIRQKGLICQIPYL
jgi:hypothetical protein